MTTQPAPDETRTDDRVATQRAARIENLAAIEEIVSALSAAERGIAILTAERDAARAETERLAKWAQKYYDSGAPHGRMCGQSPCICGRTELGHALIAHRAAPAVQEAQP